MRLRNYDIVKRKDSVQYGYSCPGRCIAFEGTVMHLDNYPLKPNKITGCVSMEWNSRGAHIFKQEKVILIGKTRDLLVIRDNPNFYL